VHPPILPDLGQAPVESAVKLKPGCLLYIRFLETKMWLLFLLYKTIITSKLRESASNSSAKVVFFQRLFRQRYIFAAVLRSGSPAISRTITIFAAQKYSLVQHGILPHRIRKPYFCRKYLLEERRLCETTDWLSALVWISSSGD